MQNRLKFRAMLSSRFWVVVSRGSPSSFGRSIWGLSLPIVFQVPPRIPKVGPKLGVDHLRNVVDAFRFCKRKQAVVDQRYVRRHQNRFKVLSRFYAQNFSTNCFNGVLTRRWIFVSDRRFDAAPFSAIGRQLRERRSRCVGRLLWVAGIPCGHRA